MAVFDIYIEYLKAKFAIDVQHTANQAKLVGGGVEVAFPHYDPASAHFSVCKGSYIRKLRQQSSDALFVIGIGDGWSDRSLVHDVDLLFACNNLVHYCNDNAIDYQQFNTFNDIVGCLSAVLR